MYTYMTIVIKIEQRRLNQIEALLNDSYHKTAGRLTYTEGYEYGCLLRSLKLLLSEFRIGTEAKP